MLRRRLKKFSSNISKTMKNFGFIINMLRKTAPWSCVAIMIIETLISFIPLAFVYVNKKIIDSILSEYTDSAARVLILWCVFLATINILSKVLTNVKTIISTKSGAKINKRISELIIQKCTEFDVSLPLLSEDACVSMPQGTYLDRSSIFSFKSSLGADITYDYQTCGLSFSCSMTEGEKKFSGHWQKGATRFDKLTGLDEEIRAAIAEQAYFMRNSVPVTPGKYPVVLSPEAAGVFAHESFGHKSESDFMLSDESMRNEWQLGKTVGSPILSIAECGSVPGCGYVPYDDEGTRARKNYLIKDGALVGRLHNAQTAAALDESPTGNARAIDCTFEPIVRMTNTYIEGGDMNFDQLIAPIKKGYFIKTISHGSGMSTFTIAPRLAYEIVDGKLGRPVQISVLTGSVFETLGLIDGLTSDVHLLSFVTGGCGKMEQMGLPVGFGGPYVRVSSMNVQ